MAVSKKGERRRQILESLVSMLEEEPGLRITTAKLAERVGVSEAALYRHFPSKTKMFEGLIDFTEETLFSRASMVLTQETTAQGRCEKLLLLLLTFAEKNPGICRLLTCDALVGETEKLRKRIGQLFDRLETQIKQVLREAEIKEGIRPVLPVPSAANLLLSSADGKIVQYVRSNFERPPTQCWNEQWNLLMQGFFKKTMSANLS
ncbi:MAG: nucleoid occlusion factor SlmA [Cellvibrionales bacterium]|nr:nucleoid occlusion factor SlmA [Cellvibrionales bacterium]